ncbi:Pycsar system effector family protein [Sphaerisporangium dianthi]|uniref:Pycsar system effector family protein n=1 Tax=Sphaerisporangium dianthi TaxID=1436120 RepID=A0ABV9CMX1_9ACTN
MEEKSLGRLLELLSEVRGEIGRADQKAAIVLGAAGVGAGALVGAAASGQWSRRAIPGPLLWSWWAGVLAFFLGILALTAALYPRAAPRSPGSGRAYFGEFAETFTAAVALGRENPDEGTRRSVELAAGQLRRLGAIVDRKYGLIRWGMLLLLVSLSCCAVSFLLAQIIG